LVKVSLNKTEKNKEIFEIQNSDINVAEIMRDIESSLRQRSIDKSEIDRITRLQLTSDSPAGHREFDPSLTANLFEKGISPPKFSNPRYWFIKGPLKWIIIKVTEFYSLVDKKLSENRIKAFYSVLHELILLKAKHQRLESKLAELYKHVVELKASSKTDFQINFYDNYNLLSDRYSKSDTRILSFLKKEKPTLILLPDWDNFLNLLKLNRIDFHAIVSNKNQFNYIEKQITNHVSFVEEMHEFTQYENYSNIILYCNACLLPVPLLEKIVIMIMEKADSGTQCFIRFTNYSINNHSPFQENFPTQIDSEKVYSYLNNIGFRNIIFHSVSKEEMELITFSLP
jgi:hypothetical protein